MNTNLTFLQRLPITEPFLQMERYLLVVNSYP